MLNSAPSPFAAAAQPTSSWLGDSIIVPGGQVRVEGAPQLLIFGDRVVGLVLADRVAMMRMPPKGSADCAMVIEQVVGYLHANEVHVVRLRIRFPIQWVFQRNRKPRFRAEQCVVHWVRTFLADRYFKCRMDLPPHVLVPIAVQNSLRAGLGLWSDAAAILLGLQYTDPTLLAAVGPDVMRVARWWETHVLRMIRRAQLEDWIAREDVDVVRETDCYWKQCVRMFPSYKTSPLTSARVL